MTETMLIPADKEDRDKIAGELDRTFLVEAGAGSGKTRSLVDRMTACLRTGTCGIETLAAVTFTHKAAAELRERFQTGLEEAYGRAAGEERRRLGRSLRNLEQCFIGTIHSFCAGMLKERPIEIGLVPDFREIEDIEDAVFREGCWHDHLARVRWERPAELSALEEVGLAPEDLKSAFDTICEFPELLLEGGRDMPPDFGRIRADLESLLKTMRRVVPRRSQDEDQDDFQQRMKRLFFRQRNIGFEDPMVLMETLEELLSGFKVVQKRWDDRETAKAAGAELERFRGEVIGPALTEWREYRHPRVIAFMEPAVRYFYEERKRRSLVNFTDLLLSASALLRNNPGVREYFQNKYTHILVDEFQDTDPIQAEVLMYLTGTDREEQEWRRITPRPGSLFLVGDPKQSIYRFRRADIDIYNLIKRRIVESGGEVLHLTANFRSLGSLGRWNNPIFEGRFPAGGDGYQAEYAPLAMVREDEEGFRSGVYKITVEAKPRHRQDLIAEEDAARVADWIRGALSGSVRLARTPGEIKGGRKPGAEPGDFMILFRYKKQMDVYARALEERGIPYEITGGSSFAAGEDIREIVLLAMALREPENPVYTAAVLRGIFFGVSDQQLWEFKRAGGRFDFLGGGVCVPPSPASDEGGIGEPEDGERPDDSSSRGKGGGGGEPDAVSVRRGGEEGQGGCAPRETSSDDNAAEDRDRSAFSRDEGRGAASVEKGREEWPEGAGYAARCLEEMRHWWLWTRRLPPSAALEKILVASGLIGYLAAAEMGSSKAGNALKLLEHVRSREVEGKTTFAEAVSFLEELVAEHDVEEMSLSPGRTDAVRLMNLHKAKGLEAPVIFLANPVGLRRTPEPDRHVVRTEEGGAKGYFLFHKPVFHHRMTLSQPYGWEKWAAEERRYARAEEDRLMYVAATRARNMMVISTYAGNLPGRAWDLLDGHLDSVPELESPVSTEGRKREVLTMRAGEAAEAARILEERRAGLSTPGYGLETVTSLVKDGSGGVPEWSEAGRGMSWGRVVHALLEALGRGDVQMDDEGGLNRFAAYVLELEGRDSGEQGLLLRMVRAVLESELWARMKAAEKALFEVPFAIKIEGKDARELAECRPEQNKTLPPEGVLGSSGINGADEKLPVGGMERCENMVYAGTCPILVSGTIDLIFKEAEGWVIADYKSDETGGDVEKRQQLIDYYAPQVRLYSRFWRRITNEPVKEMGLYFTAVKRWVTVD
jgi:ATP-dependent exoDNAse (exonuclease V) beta subunit